MSAEPNSATAPLVSIITPVHNDAEYVAECIESVLAQTYQNWVYTIIDNASTDESHSIIEKYASRDSRIQVVTNDRVLPIIENHNLAVQYLAPQAKYCKFVYADDWIYPNSIEEMVRFAEQHATVGIVSAYTMDGQEVLWPGLPYPQQWLSGREVCRHKLLGGPYIFGTFTSILLRADLIRKRSPFFNEKNPHADTEACFAVLQESDFGFLHQVLSFSRKRPESATSFAIYYNTVILSDFVMLHKFGPVFLTEAEYRKRWKRMRQDYHQALAHNILRIRPREFWNYHANMLATVDAKIDRWMLVKGLLAELTGYSHFVRRFRGGWRWWSPVLKTGSRHVNGTSRTP